MDLKEKLALAILLSLVVGTAWIAVEHSLEPDQLCSRCIWPGPRILPDGSQLICWMEMEPWGGVNRRCPQCGRRWKALGSSIEYVIRQRLSVDP